MSAEIPATWAEMEQQALDAVENLEAIKKTPLPESIAAARDGDFLESGQGALETILGLAAPGTMKEWKTRVIRLSDANKIMRSFERDLVLSFVLSPASPGRLIYDGIVRVPRWIAEHLPELIFIVWPLLVAGLKEATKQVILQSKILDAQAEIRRLRKYKAYIYGLLPMPAGIEVAEWVKLRDNRKHEEDYLFPAERLRMFIDGADRDIDEQQRLLDVYFELQKKSETYLQRAAAAISIVLIYLSVEKLIAVGKTVKDIAVSISPVKKLKDDAIEAVKSKSLPQVGRRKWVRKSSRRN